jgi:hypothetical protein
LPFDGVEPNIVTLTMDTAGIAAPQDEASNDKEACTQAKDGETHGSPLPRQSVDLVAGDHEIVVHQACVLRCLDGIGLGEDCL